jgi:2-haloacid dehalogenase
MQQLRAQGYRLATLTHTSAARAKSQLQNTRQKEFLDNRYSVESVKRNKPDPAPYRIGLEDQGIEAADTLMVAAHTWNLTEAKNVGRQTAFIQHPDTSLYPNVARPDYIEQDLKKLAASLMLELA